VLLDDVAKPRIEVAPPRGRAQGGEVGRDHGEQGLERVLAADDPGDDELDRQDDGLEDEDHDDDPQEGLMTEPAAPV